jgi:AraC-like DNA-binding protein
MRIVFPDFNPYPGGFVDQPTALARHRVEGKVNSTDIAEWLVSPGVRSSYLQNGAVLLDFTHRHYYTLNGLAARLWGTIEARPSGIAVEDIVCELEAHFDFPRQELERDAAQCLADLQSAGLVGEKVVENDESVDRISASSESGARGRESMHQGGRIMIYEQQFVQRFESVESLVGQLFQEGLKRDVDWRAKKLKDFIDDAPGNIHGSLRAVCDQLQLSLSERQARRLFKDTTGISVREYARKRRLVVAARQLQDTDKPIKVIATDAAYRTVQGFEKGFYAMFRLTPMEFRKMWHRSQVTA